MDKTYNIEMTKKFEKAMRSVASEDKKLAAEVFKQIDLLESNKHEQLTIELIKRKKGKHKIWEVKIYNPQSFRIFFVYIVEKDNEILLVDGRKKKQDRFSNEYYNDLDKAIDNYIAENG